MANVHGTFYEVPLITNGRPPAWNQMRPVASHRKQITDFCTWNGLLVLAGVSPGGTDDPHRFVDPDLMTGYDQKSVKISHDHRQPVAITWEIDIDGRGHWSTYKTFDIAPAPTAQNQFPNAYSACWIRAISNTSTTATVPFDYRSVIGKERRS